MPYILKKVKGGIKVCKKNNPSTCFSKKPLSIKQAVKQRTAINLSELKKSRIKGKGALILTGSYNVTPYAPISK